jgi:hypothetical protein
MRAILPVFLLFLAAVPALAADGAPDLSDARERQQVCMIDKHLTETGKEYDACDADPENNSLIAKGYKAARLDRQTQKARQAIWVHDQCRFVDNVSGTTDYFVPFATAEEWESFRRNPPKNIRMAGCCEPRDLLVTDIITPSQKCPGGWLLQSVVSMDDYTTVLMTPSGNNFIGLEGVKVELPLLRDDENAIFEYHGQKQFAARFACTGGEPPVTGTPVPDKPEDDITIIGTAPDATPGEIGHVPFVAKCNRKRWLTISVRPCTPSEHVQVASCQDYGFPVGTVGEVQIISRTICPAEQRSEEVVTSGCRPPNAP